MYRCCIAVDVINNILSWIGEVNELLHFSKHEAWHLIARGETQFSQKTIIDGSTTVIPFLHLSTTSQSKIFQSSQFWHQTCSPCFIQKAIQMRVLAFHLPLTRIKARKNCNNFLKQRNGSKGRAIFL